MNRLKNSVAGSFALIATFVTVAAATPLRAETVSIPVAYGDLNVHSDAGASALRGRISRAARLACGREEPGSRLDVAKCRRAAIQGANAQLAMKAGATDVALASR